MVKPFVKYLIWSIAATLWATICFVVPDFVDNPVGDWKALLSVIAYIISVGIFQFFIIYLIGANKYVCAAVLPIYALLGSVCSYYRLFYHVSITPLLLDAVLHTNPQEAYGVISVILIIWVVVSILIAVFFCWQRFRIGITSFPWWYGIAIVALLVIYYFAIPRLRTGLSTRYPMNVVYSVSEYISNQNKVSSIRQIPMIVHKETPDSLIIIAVLGEATRADHMQLNGYERPTNPILSSRSNIVSLPHIYSPYTNTTNSIPHIITRADSAHMEYAYTESSFVPLFRENNFHTIWLSNQDLEKPLHSFLHETDTTLYTPAAIRQSLYNEWLDSDLLPLTDLFIGQVPRQLIILHTTGSHWLYDTHVTKDFFVFQPTVSNRDIRQNTIEQIVNSYDNTIVYLDSFLDSIITKIEHYPAILLYLSDHGESLGEGGRFLHAQDNAEEEKNPAAIVWYSDKYAALYPDKIKALIQNKDKHYRTDYYFYSILYAAGIEAEGDNPDVNIFRVSNP